MKTKLKNKSNGYSFKRWFKELKAIAVSSYGFLECTDFDEKAWKEYYDLDFTANSAMKEDLSHA